MKKFLVLASLLVLIGAGKSMAGQADLFSYDAITVNNQMAQLDQLEGYVLDNPGITLGQMTTERGALVSVGSDSYGINGINLTNEKVFGVPGFFWGCLLSVPGVVIVYFLSDQDKAETKMAIIGCVVEAVVWGGWSLVWTVALGHSYYW